MRTYISAPLMAFLSPRLIGKRLSGFMRGLATTALGVFTTAPISGAITAALFADPSNFISSYTTALATTIPLAMIANYLVVGPIVKMLFNNHITPAGGLNALKCMQQNATSVLRMFGM